MQGGLKQTKKQTKEEVGYIILAMNCYPRNGLIKDPNLTSHKLYYPKQYQYFKHPFLWVALNIGTKHPTKLVRLTVCLNATCEMQKP